MKDQLFTLKFNRNKAPVVLENVRSIRMRKSGILRVHLSDGVKRYPLNELTHVRLAKPVIKEKTDEITAD